jgi:hypothetical protein
MVTLQTHPQKFPLVSMGGYAEGLACGNRGARTPIGTSRNFPLHFINPKIAKFERRGFSDLWNHYIFVI